MECFKAGYIVFYFLKKRAKAQLNKLIKTYSILEIH